MKRALLDLSSIIWTGLLAGKDKEFGREYPDSNGKMVHVNSADYGYENVIAHVTTVMDDIHVQPHQMIFVMEGKNSKAERQGVLATYKQGREKVPQQYEEFNKCKEQVLQAFLGLGAQVCWQDHGVEADDVLGYLALNLDGERIIVSGDKDLAQVVGAHPDIHHWRQGVTDKNPFGDFPHKYIPVYIALVGDTSDKIPGARGFGEVAFTKMLATFGEDVLPVMEGLIKNKQLSRLQEDLHELKELQKVIDDAENVYTSYELGRLRIEKINTLRRPLSWRAGMVKPREACEDQRLRKYAGVVKLVSAENYDEAFKWAADQIARSPFVALDIETSTPPESDEWLERLGKDEDKTPVDVFGSELTSLQMTFGPNLQYTVYLPADNVPEPGVSNVTYAQIRDFVNLIPRGKHTVVHNAAFELPVCYMAWGGGWSEDPEYHGFLRNVIDSALMSSYVDENRSKGLKSLSSTLLGYEQTTYQQVTTKTFRGAVVQQDHGSGVPSLFPVYPWRPEIHGGRKLREYTRIEENGQPYVDVQFKMNELTAREVLSYGADDPICTAALAVHFSTVMEIERSWQPFLDVEQLPAYVTAKAFLDGADFSLETMREMEKDDDAAYDEAWAVLRQYLIKIDFDGTICPTFTAIAPAAIKEAYQIVTGQELKTLVRTPSKLAKLICEQADSGAPGDEETTRATLLAATIYDNDLKSFNQLVERNFSGEPEIDLNSPKQMAQLIYDRMKLPINIVNKVTPLERQHNPDLADALYKFNQYRLGKVTELSPEEWALVRKKAKANDDAIDYAIAFDSDHLADDSRAALKAIGTMKKVLTRRQLFYRNYWNLVHWKDGKIHAQTNQCAAVTRRYSQANPNLGQLPKKGEVRFREGFKPHKKDAVVVSIDFTGQELRLAAGRSQDRNMLACFVGDKKKDMHSLTAAGAMKLKWGMQVVADAFASWGVGLVDTPEGCYELFIRLRELGKAHVMGKKADDLRKDSKNVNFAAQFGGQAVKLSETLIMPVADAQLFLDARAEMFPDVDEAAKRAEEKCKQTGYAQTMLGVRRHLREAILSDNKQEVSRAARQAWNMEIQGSAAEMTKLAMGRLWKSGALHRYDVRFIAPIHDELVTSVAREHALEFIRIKHSCMVAPYADMQVPILASISLGPDFANQIECGDWYIPERITAALNDTFTMKEAA